MSLLNVFIVVASFAMVGEASARICPTPWRGAGGDDCVRRIHEIKVQSNWTPIQKTLDVKIRSGYLAESPYVPFRGNVLYYEGLADSMINQMPLFSKLTANGFRVIAFDYMGQGGSDGDMNDTRILEIPRLGEEVLKIHGRELQSHPKKFVIGWSTGGLAAYVEALNHPERIERVALIAPGIVPKLFVGEQHPLSTGLNRITLATLTSADYSLEGNDPHLDPIMPESPLDVFTGFAFDLIYMSKQFSTHEMSKDVKGFALYGTDDSYVKPKAGIRVLKKRVPQFGKTFTVKIYEGARHEIQNERGEIRSEAHKDIVDFLTGARQPGAK